MITDEAREHVRAHLVTDEGLVLHAYQDSEGFWTIGIGHLIDQRRGGRIPARIAYDLLEDDIDVAVRSLVARYPWFPALDPVRMAVVVELRFNLGDAGLAKFVNTLAAIERGDWDAAARGLKSSRWFKQVQNSRSSRLLQMLTTGAWPATPWVA